jgi:glycosyltransferase involved in cell wall biosynthesis
MRQIRCGGKFSPGEKEKPLIGVILPCYEKNEEIVKVVNSLHALLSASGFNHVIVVVDDGSSVPIQKNVQACVKYFRHKYNMGKGAAIRTGAQNIDPEVICLFDADLDIEPSCLIPMINAVLSGQCDLAIGSKRHPNSQLIYPILRKIISRCFFEVQTFLFSLPKMDTQTGAKVLSKKCIPILLETNELGFLIDIDLLVEVQRSGYSIEEYPVVINHGFSSTVSFKDIKNMTFGILRIWWKKR